MASTDKTMASTDKTMASTEEKNRFLQISWLLLLIPSLQPNIYKIQIEHYECTAYRIGIVEQ
jgi:hypothetical protein